MPNADALPGRCVQTGQPLSSNEDEMRLRGTFIEMWSGAETEQPASCDDDGSLDVARRRAKDRPSDGSKRAHDST
jgi:hypothetical protein